MLETIPSLLERTKLSQDCFFLNLEGLLGCGTNFKALAPV